MCFVLTYHRGPSITTGKCMRHSAQVNVILASEFALVSINQLDASTPCPLDLFVSLQCVFNRACHTDNNIGTTVCTWPQNITVMLHVHLKSPATWHLVQPFVLDNIKDNIDAPRYWPLGRAFLISITVGLYFTGGLSPVRHQAIIWTNIHFLLIRPSRTKYSWIWTKMSVQFLQNWWIRSVLNVLTLSIFLVSPYFSETSEHYGVKKT